MKTFAVILFGLSTLFTTPVSVNPQREAMLDRMFNLLEKNIANPAWLETDSFNAFKKDLYSEKVLEMSDEDFLRYFKSKRHTLGFSHFDLHSKDFTKKIEAENADKPKMSWKPLNDEIAYLNVKTFIADGSPMVKILSEIGVDTYKHLIIDLRYNGGGSLDAPVILGRFLTGQPIDAGVYLTRKWFLKHGRSATADDIAKMPFLQDFTFAGITKMYEDHDAFRMVLPPHDQPVFQGKVYVLVNGNTASACEPLIDLFKKMDIATLVGTTSAGNMLSGQWFQIDDNYKAFIPISDYQTANGDRLDQIGVAPHHMVPSEKALNYVLDELIGKDSN